MPGERQPSRSDPVIVSAKANAVGQCAEVLRQIRQLIAKVPDRLTLRHRAETLRSFAVACRSGVRGAGKEIEDP
jgi:hypothetical protein